MAARGEAAAVEVVKAALLRAPGPSRRRQARDLPPGSDPRSDWLLFFRPSTPTNQITRLSFQLLKGSAKAKQARMSPQQHR